MDASMQSSSPFYNAKEFVQETDLPSKISEIQFGLMTATDMQRVSHVEVVNPFLHQEPTLEPLPHGVLDRRMGVCDAGKVTCETCGEKVATCVGHFGFVRLHYPVFHIGYLRSIRQLLQVICKKCSRVLVGEEDRERHLARLRSCVLEQLGRDAIVKELIDKCKAVRYCPYCGHYNGKIKQVGALRIVHHVSEPGEQKGAISSAQFMESFSYATCQNEELKAHLHRAQEVLHPLRVSVLFRAVSAEDCELVGMDAINGRPEDMLLTHVLVPPVCIRPSVTSDSGRATTQDDITRLLEEIIHLNLVLEKNVNGKNLANVMQVWEMLQLEVAKLIDSDLPGISTAPRVGSKPVRALCQRLKGKTGRFRGNLSGKRVDFTARTVISPDPNLSIEEVAVPLLVAKDMTYPEKVTQYNIKKLRECVQRGSNEHPGALAIIKPDLGRISLRGLPPKIRGKSARELRFGDVIERHLEDGDVVLFNRQPSLHRMSIMAHKARVMPHRTFRFNECVCNPYNADFDGDEMNLHLPQTEEARSEALLLMGVKRNLVTPKNGEPLIAAIQDFITASYLISRKSRFYTREEFTQIISYFCDERERIEIPPPAIIKPMQLWTGKQVFGVWLRPNKQCPVRVNFETTANTYNAKLKEGLMSSNDAYVCIRDSELMCGTMDKKTLGAGKKENVFHVLMRDFGPEVAGNRMSTLARLCCRWLGNHGFSIGISDVQPSTRLQKAKAANVQQRYDECDELIEKYRRGELDPQPGCTVEETVEALIHNALSSVREDAGDQCLKELHHLNAPLIMNMCGSKGSKINISQMVACVGQQDVTGSRIENGFVYRTLPHFDWHDKRPNARGFVANSFYSGMTATEFFFHTVAGRVGLVDTAVKTATTGYMQRRLMKALEDLSIQYDMTVRNSSATIVQFTYGDDCRDPSGMEGDNKPVEFPRLLEQVKVQFEDTDGQPLTVKEIKEVVEVHLASDTLKRETNDLFVSDLRAFFEELFQTLDATEELVSSWGLSETDRYHIISSVHHYSKANFEAFFRQAIHKYSSSVCESGMAVGALAAQSIGEPGTQMTLKTFHFAGVASMNITSGVPRIIEIINASKTISTPVISAQLVNSSSEIFARIVKSRIETTTLGNVAVHIREVYKPRDCYLSVKLDLNAIAALCLELTISDVRRAILATKGIMVKEGHVIIHNASKLRIFPPKRTREKMYFSMQLLKNMLPTVVVKGIPGISRAVINSSKETVDGEEKKSYKLVIEGSNLLDVMGTPGVEASQATSNHVIETERVLGIEAARQTIINEMIHTMSGHGLKIDIRHMTLLGDVMSFKGQIHGIHRFGIGKLKDSVLMLASFEKTTQHLFDGARRGIRDAIEGVSECVIVGQPIPLGTGMMKVLKKTSIDTQPRRPLLLQSEDLKVY